MTDKPQRLKSEDYAFNLWDDQDFRPIVERYKAHRKDLIEQAKQKGLENYEPNQDVPPHIRNWFENPIYQLLVKPSLSQISAMFSLSKKLTVLTFGVGVFLLLIGVVALLLSSDPITVASLILSGIASVLASLFKSAAIIRDTATQYAKLQASISAGMVSLDTLQRIVGHQENLTKEDLETVRGIIDALAPLIKAFEQTTSPNDK